MEETNAEAPQVDGTTVNGGEVTKEEKLKNALRNYFEHQTETRVSKQCELYAAMAKSIDQVGEVPDAAIKFLCKTVITICVDRYTQRKSMQLASKLISKLSEKAPITTLEHLSAAISRKFPQTPTRLSRSMAAKAAVCGGWLVAALRRVKSASESTALTYTGLSALSKTAYHAMYTRGAGVTLAKKLNALIDACSDNMLMEMLRKQQADIESLESVCCLISLLLSCPEVNSPGSEKWKKELATIWLEAYTKCAFGAGKNPLSDHVKATKEIVNRLSAQQLATLQQAAKKGLLRAPEVAVYGVRNFTAGMPLGQDSICIEIFTSLTGCLTHPDEGISRCAIEACGHLAKVVCESAAMESMLDRSLTQVKESQSKSTPKQKVALWDCIKLLAGNGVSVKDPFCEKLCKPVSSLLSTEGNEEVAQAIWSAVGAWILGCGTLNMGCVSLLEQCAGLRAGAMRLAGLRVASQAYNKSYDVLKRALLVGDAEIAATLLTTAVDTFKKSPTGQVSHESNEIIPLAILLLQAFAKGQKGVEKNLVERVEVNPLFAKEKFISQLTQDDALLVPLLLRCLKATGRTPDLAIDAFGTLLATCLFWPSYIVRKEALRFVKELLANDMKTSTTFSTALAEGFQSGLFDKIYAKLHSREKKEEGDEFLVPGWNACQMVECLLPTSFGTQQSGPTVELLASSLFACSQERIVEHNGSLWIHWAMTHKETIAPVLRLPEFSALVTNRLFSAETSLETCTNVVRLLVSLGELGHDVSRAFWQRCSQDVHSIDVSVYTGIPEDQIAIYHTKDGTLYNTSVIEASIDDAEAKNVRRENKAYSYKEQMAEIQLRKELAEKQRKEGKLTAKQQKAIDDELKAEKEIRAHLKALYESAERKLALLSVAARYSPTCAFENVHLLYDVVVPLLHSPLAAEPATRALLAFRDAFFDPSNNYHHELVAHTALRVLNSKHLYLEWSQEPLDKQLRRLFAMLSSSCAMYKLCTKQVEFDDVDEVEAGFDEMGEDLPEEGITAPKLGFMLPLLEGIFSPANADSELKSIVAAFLKDAVCASFIKVDEAGSPPILKLGTLLLRVASLQSATEFDCNTNLFSALDGLYGVLAHYPVSEASEAVGGIETFILVIASYFAAEDSLVRRKALEGFHTMKNLLMQLCLIREQPDYKTKLQRALLLAQRDPDSESSTLASAIWMELHFQMPVEMLEKLIDDETLLSPKQLVRDEAAICLRDLIEQYPDETGKALSRLSDVYSQYSQVLPPERDIVGRIVKSEIDRWEVRSSVAKALLLLSELIGESELLDLLVIVTDQGLNDRSEQCREIMCQTGVNAIKMHGVSMLGELLPFLEMRLDAVPPAGEYDNLRTGLIILIGTLAQHLDPSKSADKIRKIVARLVEALSTPSQQVQESVAKCLPPLVPMLKGEARELLKNMLALLEHADSYGERRGAAYGIAALTKGLGLVVIKEMEVITHLRRLLSQSNARSKESALLCIEMFCKTIGKLFEPYSVQLLSELLKAFGDSSDHVRTAANDAAKSMMKALSAHGLKLVLPSLLKALEGESGNWRTKCAATDMLGAMAYCAPRQLAACLPKIVPRLCEVLTDSHSKVQKCGERALKQIAQVIRSPEFLSISSHLVAALMDPANKTKPALEVVVNTRFVHAIDSPSLALLIPLVNRAFGDRNVDTRRMGANIIANLYSLADHREIAEYLPILVPGVRKLLVDPAPDVRTVASKALGAIIRYSPPSDSESLQSEIVPWLKQCLVSKSSAVDRSGAAQGMCEIIAALGDEFLKANMPTVIRITESSSTEAPVRDGYLLLYIYMPSVLGDSFLPYIPLVIPSILRALADETEYVRDSAMKAAQRLIAVYSGQAKKLLLPQLLDAVIHENWRIRHASVQLIGEFLFQIGGVSGKMTSETTDEDETLGMESVNKAVVRFVGQECRDQILASLYLARHDVSLLVRQTASHTWKVVVGNTQKTVKELMPTLFGLILLCVASEYDDRQQIGKRCLAELAKKMGEKLMASVLPLLQKQLQSEDTMKRRQVAVALGELLTNANREAVENNLSSLIGPVRAGLSDPSEEVRSCATTAFTSLYLVAGPTAIDEIVIPMLDEYTKNGVPEVLEGLCLVVARGRGLLASLLPRITKPPVNSAALCQLAAANPDSLSRNLAKVLEALVCPPQSLNCPLDEHVANVTRCLLAISDEDGVATMVSTLMKRSTTNIVASVTLREFVSSTEANLAGVAEQLIQGLLPLYGSQDEDTVNNAVETLNALVNNFAAEQLLELVLPLKRIAGQMFSLREDKKTGAVAELSGLSQPAGWKALLAIMREGLISPGAMELKELAGLAMAQLIAMSGESGLKPYAVNMAGPFIRVLGDRQPPAHVKIAVLTALLKLLDKVPTILRPFLPQIKSMLQRIQKEDAATSPTLAKLAENGMKRLGELFE